MATLDRDLAFFLVFFAAGLALGWGAPAEVRVPAGIAFLLAYAVYVRRTLVRGGDTQAEDTLHPLIMERRARRRQNPALGIAVLQLLVGLGAMVGGAHLFVEQLLHIAEDIGVEPIVLVPDPGPARHRAAREGQQLLLGP